MHINSDNNKGVTLVELIVAMAIFVAAIVPMLYAFVYSTGFNFKSQRTMQSTGIAQAVIEKCKSLNFNEEQLEDVLNSSTGETIFDGTEFSVDGGEDIDIVDIDGKHLRRYWIYDVHSNPAGEMVDAGNTSRRSYDVAIDLKEIHDSAMDYSIVQSMSYNATYCFADSLMSSLKFEDRTAQSKAIEKINALIDSANVQGYTGPAEYGTNLGAYFSEDDIDISRIVIDRDILINIGDKDAYTSSGSNPISVDVKVKYYVGYDNSGTIDGKADTGEFTISGPSPTIGGHTYNLYIKKSLDSDYTYDTHTTPVYEADFSGYVEYNELASAVYFYYYPGYRTIDDDTASFRDHFVINNDMSDWALDEDGNEVKKLDFYLFKQYDRDLDVASHTRFLDRESTYFCDVKINSSGHYTYFYNNLEYTTIEDVITHNFSIERNTISSPGGISISVGSKCFDCSVADTGYTNYASSYKKQVESSPVYGENGEGSSYLLSNYPVLPYYHQDWSNGDITHSSVDGMPYTRYRIVVRVYPHGDNAEGNEVETMTGEMLNW